LGPIVVENTVGENVSANERMNSLFRERSFDHGQIPDNQRMLYLVCVNLQSYVILHHRDRPVFR